MEADLQDRGFKATVPDDPTDPALFGQPVETAKDAATLAIRRFFDQLTSTKLAELPTVAKYALDSTANTDPYETFLAVLQEYPDNLERLPHVAVLGGSARNKRMTVGRPILGAVQRAPRVETRNAAPFALTSVAAQVSTITVTAAAPGAYTATVGGVSFTYTAVGGDSAEDIAEALRALLREGVDPIISVSRADATLTLEAWDPGSAFSVAVSANLSTTTTTAASASDTEDVLVLETDAGQVRVTFHPRDFVDITAATAEEVATAITCGALETPNPIEAGVCARALSDGRVRVEAVGSIEVSPETSAGALAALGLADEGDAAPGDSITALGGGVYALNVVGAGFDAAMVDRFVVLTGATSEVNNQRFPVVAVPSADVLHFQGSGLVPEGFEGHWFVGLQDDTTNPARPPGLRYHQAHEVTLGLFLYAESSNERRELADLIRSLFAFSLEEQHFAMHGRGVFDEDFDTEHYQVSVHADVSDSDDADFARPNDEGTRVYTRRLTVPVTIWCHLDRAVFIPGTMTPYGQATWEQVD